MHLCSSSPAFPSGEGLLSIARRPLPSPLGKVPPQGAEEVPGRSPTQRAACRQEPLNEPGWPRGGQPAKFLVLKASRQKSAFPVFRKRGMLLIQCFRQKMSFRGYVFPRQRHTFQTGKSARAHIAVAPPHSNGLCRCAAVAGDGQQGSTYSEGNDRETTSSASLRSAPSPEGEGRKRLTVCGG